MNEPWDPEAAAGRIIAKIHSELERAENQEQRRYFARRVGQVLHFHLAPEERIPSQHREEA